MKKNLHSTALRYFTHVLSIIALFLIASPIRSVPCCVQIETQPANKSVQAINAEDAVNISKEYLSIENTKEYKIIIKEKVITADAFNTYRVLESGIKRSCWVVTLIVPDSFGNSRTVYVDKENGEVLGGYSSK